MQIKKHSNSIFLLLSFFMPTPFILNEKTWYVATLKLFLWTPNLIKKDLCLMIYLGLRIIVDQFFIAQCICLDSYSVFRVFSETTKLI